MAEQPKKLPTGYLEQNLIPGEEITFRGRVHWIVLAGAVTTGLVLSIAGIVMIYYGLSDGQSDRELLAWTGVALVLLATVVVLQAVWRRNATEFAVTNLRIILKMGLIKRRTEEILLQKVESIIVNQGFLGQLLHYGTVTIRGTGGTFEPCSHVARALELRRQVHEQIARSAESRDRIPTPKTT